MRILIACPTFAIGGTATHALNLSRAFHMKGHSTAALVVEPYGHLYKEFEQSFDRLMVVPRRLEGRSAYLARLMSAIAAFHPDAIINDAVPFVQAGFRYLSPAIVKLSVIHSIVDAEVRSGIADAAYLDRVVAVSPNVASAAVALAGKAKVSLIPVGVPTSEIVAHKDSPGSEINLLYVGRICRVAKNLGVIERIVDRLYQCRVAFSLTLIGDGDYRREMEGNLMASPFSAKVKFTGALSPREIASQFRRHHVLLMTSTYEGTPHALLEAMCAGLVPVCSKIAGATDQTIEHGISGYLCDTNDVEQYVSAITRLTTDIGLFSRLSSGAHERISRDFTIQKIAGRYLQLMTEAAATSAGRAHDVPGRLAVSSELKPYCHSFVRHLRRQAGDYFRYRFRGIKPICVGPEHLDHRSGL